MNNLSRDKQIEIIAALTEGMSIRAVERLTGVHRDTIMRLGARVGRGCAELHDRMFVGIRTGRLELDELWAFVGCKQKNVTRKDLPVRGDQYTFIALASSAKAIIAYQTGKRHTDTTDLFIRDLRERVLGTPEISTDGLHPYQNAIRDAFGRRAAHGVINKTYSVTNLATPEASRRYSPGRCSSRKPRGSNRAAHAHFDQLTLNGKISRADGIAAVHPAHKRFQQEARKSRGGGVAVCRALQSLPLARDDPQYASGSPWPTDHAWSIGELLDAALAVATPDPTETAPDRRRRFRVIEGGKAIVK